jgi:subtilisin family serine protease
VVPDGDEYDKDIALGIRYAVDNGAKIINMSFGKSFSPQQGWVDSAIRYAAQKDVLLIHSAGNEKYDLNTKQVYPNPYSDIFQDTANNMITVAASSDSSIKGTLLTDFSNFGNKVVDIISPGDKIYSTLPNNNYGYLSGTSMASPIVSHIAALIRAYYPQLSAIEVKKILIQSCWKPTDPEAASALSNIAKSGGIINAAKAVEFAATFPVKDNKKKKTYKN